MSERLRIAFAVEGPNDAIVLRAIIAALLPDPAHWKITIPEIPLQIVTGIMHDNRIPLLRKDERG